MGDSLETVLHNFRVQIDACIKQAHYLKGGNKEDEIDAYQNEMGKKAGREIAIVYTKLQEAKMWAGKCLEVLGSELPKEFQDKA